MSQEAFGKLYLKHAKVSTGFCEMKTAKNVLRKYLYQSPNEKEV
jgi:hypothetical protein